MNPTLAQLAHEAGTTVTAELEKFAELIVRECAKIIEAQDCDPSFKNRLSWAMKDKFGVDIK